MEWNQYGNSFQTLTLVLWSYDSCQMVVSQSHASYGVMSHASVRRCATNVLNMPGISSRSLSTELFVCTRSCDNLREMSTVDSTHSRNCSERGQSCNHKSWYWPTVKRNYQLVVKIHFFSFSINLLKSPRLLSSCFPMMLLFDNAFTWFYKILLLNMLYPFPFVFVISLREYF